MANSPENIEEVDILVVGAGINGAAIALDASLRGLSISLVDKGDIGSGSSSGCFRIAHGGLRYLQHFDFKRMFESVREQRLLRQNVPYLLKPMQILVPCYGFAKKSKIYLGLGLYFYEALTFWRNSGVKESLKLSLPKFLSKEEVLKEVPSLKTESLKGAAVFSDCQILNCDRLTYAVAKSAKEAGADILNYTEFLSLEKDSRGSSLAVLRDVVNQKEIKVKFKLLINSAGPWLENVKSRAGDLKEKKEHFSKGLQLSFQNKQSSYALALESNYIDPAAKVSRGARSYFIVPWRERTLAGTFDVNESGSPDSFSLKNSEIENFQNELEDVFPEIKENSRSTCFGGLRPVCPDFLKSMSKDSEANVPVAREHEIREEADNIISVKGVKYTTFRALAEEVVDLAFEKLKLEKKASKTKEHSLWGASPFSIKSCRELEEKLLEFLPKGIVKRVIIDFGFSAEMLLDYLKEDSSLLESSDAFSKAEVRYALEREDCKKLSDLVFRRLPIYSLGFLNEEVARECGQIMANLKGWSPQRLSSEIAEVMAKSA